MEPEIWNRHVNLPIFLRYKLKKNIFKVSDITGGLYFVLRAICVCVCVCVCDFLGGNFCKISADFV